jgi:hypothetical protein
MYGGGFATIPAFLADIFGPQNVGAIHGALLTAWTAAAIAGPVIITELSNRAKAALPPGADRVSIYDTPLQVLAGLLAVGFVLTLLVRPLRVKAQSAGAQAPHREHTDLVAFHQGVQLGRWLTERSTKIEAASLANLAGGVEESRHGGAIERRREADARDAGRLQFAERKRFALDAHHEVHRLRDRRANGTHRCQVGSTWGEQHVGACLFE